MIKKIFLTMLLTAFASSEIYCHEPETDGGRMTVERIFRDFSKEENVTRVKVGGFAMLLTKAFEKTKGVASVEVYAFDECSAELKKKFNKAVKKLKDGSYETVVSANENDNHVKIMIKVVKDHICELVVFAGDNPAMVRIKGKIKIEHVRDLINNNR